MDDATSHSYKKRRDWSINAAHHVGLHVADIKRSLHFYRDILGFEVASKRHARAPYIGVLIGYPQADVHSALLRAPASDVFIELVEFRGVSLNRVDAARAFPGTAHVAFTVSNLDQAYEYITARGVGSISPPVTATVGPNKGGRLVNIVDPDGIRIELIQPAELG
jgi:catechol 2,3-dioxygenase-like lactoylglutathione lyase family enzyme